VDQIGGEWGFENVRIDTASGAPHFEHCAEIAPGETSAKCPASPAPIGGWVQSANRASPARAHRPLQALLRRMLMRYTHLRAEGLVRRWG